MSAPRIALVHAVAVAVDPIEAAFARDWPQATRVNLLDDSLSRDLAAAGRLDDRMRERFVGLARYVVGAGADGILFTCSAFGPAIEDARNAVAVPVLKPNEAMFDDALARGRVIGMLASFRPSIGSMREEFESAARSHDTGATLRTVCVPEAMERLRAGDGEAHDRLLAEAASELAGCDALMLAQFSTARAAAAVGATTGLDVLTSPASAVARMRQVLSA